MRIITEDRNYDIPYDNSILYVEKDNFYDDVKYDVRITTNFDNILLKSFKTKEEAQELIRDIRHTYMRAEDVYMI